MPDWWSGDRGLDPHWVWQQSFVEIDQEIFSMVILFLQLIQEGQLSVYGERSGQILVNFEEDSMVNFKNFEKEAWPNRQ